MSQVQYKESDILSNLDDVCYPNPYKFFPKFDHPIQYSISSKIHLYGDDKRWALVFEVVNYNTTGYNVVNDKYYFGNCVDYKELSKGKLKETNHSLTQILSELDLIKIMDELGYLKKDASSIVIKGKKVILEHKSTIYSDKNIRGFDFETPSDQQIDIVACMRLINETHLNIFDASQADLKKFIPSDIPEIMVIDKWHHKNYQALGDKFFGDKPSSYETFQQIAKVLVTKDSKLYKPTLMPNNHWKNWPKAGNY